MQRFDPLHAGVHRLDKARLLERDSIWNANCSLTNNPIHHSNIFGESSARRLEPGRASDLLVSLTLGEGFVAAVVALSARDMVKDHHAVADAELLDAVADFCNHSRSLVAKDSGRGVGAAGNFFKVGAADAAGVNAN